MTTMSVSTIRSAASGSRGVVSIVPALLPTTPSIPTLLLLSTETWTG